MNIAICDDAADERHRLLQCLKSFSVSNSLEASSRILRRRLICRSEVSALSRSATSSCCGKLDTQQDAVDRANGTYQQQRRGNDHVEQIDNRLNHRGKRVDLC